MSRRRNGKLNNKWYQCPSVPVFLFLILLGLGILTGIWLSQSVLGISVGLVLSVIISLVASQYWEYSETMSDDQKSKKDILEKLAIYVEGKMKRYTLLFGVNAGAVVID